MTTKAIKYYTAAIYLCSNFVMFAQQPGNEDNNNGLEGADTPAAPIDDSIWVLGFLGLLFVFLKFKAKYKQGNRSQA